MPSFKDITFEQFYKLYPRRVGRFLAEKSFKKLSVKDKFDAYNGLINYIKFWKANETEKQFIPHPSTEFKKDGTGRFFVGYCSKCRTSDFFNDYELKGDSRCCKAEILPERK